MLWDFKKFGKAYAAIYQDYEKITYIELYSEGEILAKAIGQRCLVFILCSNSLGSLLGYTAFLNNKIVPLMLSDSIDNEALNFLIQKYEPSFIWFPEKASYQFSDQDIVYKKYKYNLIRLSCHIRYQMYDELGLLLTTSGSTGSPKLVRQSYQNILSNAQAIAEYLELDDTERPITTLPMSYTYGLSIINSHLFVGATIILTDKLIIQKEFWDLCKEARATSFGGVPYTYEMLDRLHFFQMQLPCLKTMTQAGGKLSLELHEKFVEYAEEKNKQFIIMYGQTEATARMSYLPFHKSLKKFGSIGRAIPGGKFYLIDEEGSEIRENDKTGELVYEGPNVTLGYAEIGDDLAKGDELGGRLLTGDLSKRDNDGYFYIEGRKKRFLKIFGNRVSLDEIEQMVKAKFECCDCASAGLDDNLYVFLTDITIKDAVAKYLSEKTKINNSAITVKIIDLIPKSDNGKTLYSKLYKYY